MACRSVTQVGRAGCGDCAPPCTVCWRRASQRQAARRWRCAHPNAFALSTGAWKHAGGLCGELQVSGMCSAEVCGRCSVTPLAHTPSRMRRAVDAVVRKQPDTASRNNVCMRMNPIGHRI